MITFLVYQQGLWGAEFRTLGPMASIKPTVVENSQLFAQRAHSARCAPLTERGVRVSRRRCTWDNYGLDQDPQGEVYTMWRRGGVTVKTHARQAAGGIGMGMYGG